MAEVIERAPPIGWLEIHSENYLVPGGPRMAALETIGEHYPLSFHGVGLSLGSADGHDGRHLDRLKELIDRFAPVLISEHLSWAVSDGIYLNDLLPLPYNAEALDVVCRNVDRAQAHLGRSILIENPSTYLGFAASEIAEADFLAALTHQTGCGILLDVNNLHVSAHNLGLETDRYLDSIPPAAIGEIHVAGHASVHIDDRTVLIDDHGAAVDVAV